MDKRLPNQEEKKTCTAEHIGHTFFVGAVFGLIVKHQIFKRQLRSQIVQFKRVQIMKLSCPRHTRMIFGGELFGVIVGIWIGLVFTYLSCRRSF